MHESSGYSLPSGTFSRALNARGERESAEPTAQQREIAEQLERLQAHQRELLTKYGRVLPHRDAREPLE